MISPSYPFNANARNLFVYSVIGLILLTMSPLSNNVSPIFLVLAPLIPGILGARILVETWEKVQFEFARMKESKSGNERRVVGAPPDREVFETALQEAAVHRKVTLEKYLVGWKIEDGSPLWISDHAMTQHLSVFGKKNTQVSQMFLALVSQQMARGRASGLTYMQGPGDSSLLSKLTLLAIINGRLEDLIIISPEEPCHTYNPLSDKKASRFKAQIASHVIGKTQSQIIFDALTRIIKALDASGLTWTMRDLASSLSDFGAVYPRLRSILSKTGDREVLADLVALASLLLDPAESELHSVRSPLVELANFGRELQAHAADKVFDSFNSNGSDLNLREAISEGKIIYCLLPDMKNEAKNRTLEAMFFEDLVTVMQEISAGKIDRPQDPHLVFLDHSSSQSSYDFKKLFEIASRTQIALLFSGGSENSDDGDVGPSRDFYRRVVMNVKTKIMTDSAAQFSPAELDQWFGKAVGAQPTISDYRPRDSIKAPFASGIGQEHSAIGYFGERSMRKGDDAGLAWFDFGSGNIVKGRTFAMEVEIPDHWDPYVFVNTLDNPVPEGLGVHKWLKQRALEDLERELQGGKMSLVDGSRKG